MNYPCEICGETKRCGMIVALRSTEGGDWMETSKTIVCGECAESVGGIAAASVRSWVQKSS